MAGYLIEVVQVGSAGHLRRFKVTDAAGRYVPPGLFRTQAEAEQFIDWREQVEHGLADHRAHDKTPANEPATELEWQQLFERYPGSPLRAIWFAITGRSL